MPRATRSRNVGQTSSPQPGPTASIVRASEASFGASNSVNSIRGAVQDEPASTARYGGRGLRMKHGRSQRRAICDDVWHGCDRAKWSTVDVGARRV